MGRELLLGFQLTSNSPRQIGIRASVNAQSIHPGPIQLIIQLPHRLDHADIARHLENLGEINQAIGFLVVVVNRPTTNHELTDVMNAVVGLNRLFLKRQGQVDWLKGGARFIEILNRPLTETSGRETPILIGVVGRSRCQHQQLTVGDIHHDRGALLRFPLSHLRRKGLHRQFLQPGIQCELKS